MMDDCRVHIYRTALFVSDVFYVGTIFTKKYYVECGPYHI